jgi:hypothetical protein
LLTSDEFSLEKEEAEVEAEEEGAAVEAGAMLLLLLKPMRLLPIAGRPPPFGFVADVHPPPRFIFARICLFKVGSRSRVRRLAGACGLDYGTGRICHKIFSMVKLQSSRPKDAVARHVK